MAKKAAKKKAARKLGRPSSFTEEKAQVICMGLSEGLSLRQICRQPEMPDKVTVLRWLSQNETFRTQYAQAKQEGAEVLAEEILEIADDARNDYMEQLGEDGEAEGYRFMGEHVQRSKLRVDARKWIASKLLPKKYGDKLELDGKLETTVVRRNLTGAGGED